MTSELKGSRGRRDPVVESQSKTPALRGTKTTEREGKDFISETEGQVSCNGGRREISKPGLTGSSVQDGGWDRDVGETKAEADVDEAGDGLERVSATTFSGPGM